MLLKISDSKTIGRLNQEFSNYFPFLKIEFFDQPVFSAEDSLERHVLSQQSLIGTIRDRHNEGALEIDAQDTPYYITQQLKDRFGLYAQVYRAGVSSWIQTTGSDQVPLKDHNEVARLDIERKQTHDFENFLENEY